MKKIIVLSACIIFVSFLKAQGNLQFNQVKFYEFAVTQSGTTVFTESPTSVTVPAGKVWKIESAVSNSYTPSSNSTSLVSTNAGMILINGKILFQSSFTTNSSYFSQPILPMWLPAGTYTLSIKSSFLTNGLQFVGALSAIEFNVVP